MQRYTSDCFCSCELLILKIFLEFLLQERAGSVRALWQRRAILRVAPPVSGVLVIAKIPGKGGSLRIGWVSRGEGKPSKIEP